MQMQSQVVKNTDREKMKTIPKMDKCGIFIQFENEENISEYLRNVLEINNNEENIFKKLQWFIFLKREGSLEMVFRYDSKVFLITESEKGKNAFTIHETYSIEKSSQKIQIIGDWSSGNGLGRFRNHSVDV